MRVLYLTLIGHSAHHKFTPSPVFPILLFAQVRPVQGVVPVEEEMLHSDNPINKNIEEKNPTNANTVPRSLV